jgi:hypothetical protein
MALGGVLGGGVRREVLTPSPNAAPRGNYGQNPGILERPWTPLWVTLWTDLDTRERMLALPKKGEQMTA